MPDFTKEQHDFFTDCELKVINKYYSQFVTDTDNFDYIDDLLGFRICNENWVNLIKAEIEKYFIGYDIELYYEWATKGYGIDTFFKCFNEKEIEYCYNNQYDDDKPWLPAIDRIPFHISPIPKWKPKEIIYQVYCFRENTTKIDNRDMTYLCRIFSDYIIEDDD